MVVSELRSGGWMVVMIKVFCCDGQLLRMVHPNTNHVRNLPFPVEVGGLRETTLFCP